MNIKKSITKFKHAYIHNPYGYSTFFDYWNLKPKAQDILSNTIWKGSKKDRLKFIILWFKIYKYRH